MFPKRNQYSVNISCRNHKTTLGGTIISKFTSHVQASCLSHQGLLRLFSRGLKAAKEMGTHVLRDTISAPKVVSREFTCLILLTRGKTPPFLLDITFVFSFESFNLDSKMQFPIEKTIRRKGSHDRFCFVCSWWYGSS